MCCQCPVRTFCRGFFCSVLEIRLFNTVRKHPRRADYKTKNHFPSVCYETGFLISVIISTTSITIHQVWGLRYLEKIQYVTQDNTKGIEKIWEYLCCFWSYWTAEEIKSKAKQNQIKFKIPPEQNLLHYLCECRATSTSPCLNTAYQPQPVSLLCTWSSSTGKGGHKSYGPSEAGEKMS